MPEWSFAIIVGGGAGFIITLFIGGTDAPLPRLWAFVETTRFHLPYRFLQNVSLGALGSFIAWAAQSGASFERMGITRTQVLGSLAAGGAGGLIVNTFFRHAQDAESIANLRPSLDELVDRLPTQDN